jgi:drug/metabolite transporter (DMT)-like permease
MSPLRDRVDVPDDRLGAAADGITPTKGPIMSIVNLAVLLFAVALAAVGQLVLKYGMTLAQQHAHESGRSLAVVAATSPWILGGLTIFACSAVAWLLTLSRVPLSLAYPFNALGYFVILTASVLVLHERANVWTWLGTFLVSAGLVLVVMTAPGTP